MASTKGRGRKASSSASGSLVELRYTKEAGSIFTQNARSRGILQALAPCPLTANLNIKRLSVVSKAGLKVNSARDLAPLLLPSATEPIGSLFR